MTKPHGPAWVDKRCTVCGHTEQRYNNARQCLKCGGELAIVEKTEDKENNHGTNDTRQDH